MEKRLVDPRDISWEQDEAVYRVYFWDKVKMASIEYEVTESSLIEVVEFARSHAQENGWTYTLYVKVCDIQDENGLIVLEGVTGNPFL